MTRSSWYRTTPALVVCFFFPLWVAPVHGQCVGLCGDVTGDGLYTASDFIPSLRFTQTAEWYGGDSACANVDGDPGLTMRDLAILIDALVWNDFGIMALDCEPDDTPYEPVPNTGYRLRHNAISTLSVVQTKMMLHFELIMPEPTSAVALGMRVLIDGQPAVFGEIDTTTAENGPFDFISLRDERTASVPPGYLLGSWVDFVPGYESGTVLLGAVEISDAPLMAHDVITVELVELPEGDNTPMAVESGTYTGWAINVEPCIICVPGDLNNDWKITAADVIAGVYSVFKCGPCYPYPELLGADVNCSGMFTASDVVYLVNYMFKSGPPPCDIEHICEITGALGWTCP